LAALLTMDATAPNRQVHDGFRDQKIANDLQVSFVPPMDHSFSSSAPTLSRKPDEVKHWRPPTGSGELDETVNANKNFSSLIRTVGGDILDAHPLERDLILHLRKTRPRMILRSQYS
jgi:hypothetical protein